MLLACRPIGSPSICSESIPVGDITARDGDAKNSNGELVELYPQQMTDDERAEALSRGYLALYALDPDELAEAVQALEVNGWRGARPPA
jgi:hypothetical protein